MTEAKSPRRWREALAGEKEKAYFRAIFERLNAEHAQGISVYPAHDLIFNAFRLTEFCDVKVVILGQDPYHGAGQAHGLCFSVQGGVQPPPSLRNIYQELVSDVGFRIPAHGNLEYWARQGVLLLNTTLTVRAGAAHSHADIGWSRFTDHVISLLSDDREGLVFLLWGGHAMRKRALIDPGRHCILTAPHPSPLSAHRGFLGCRHFSRANAVLKDNGLEPIDWQLPLRLPLPEPQEYK